ncbi:hypothetical protein ACGFZB_12230 [Streptomyces cinerochromogenes]|uniref:Secreted protein n=1 Tax=Streptomyces cinerochromogenes TaxID=66422 RepID=A0ABW7B5R8_9ACTN
MRSGVQNFSSSVAGSVSSVVALALGDALGVPGVPEAEGDAVVVPGLAEGVAGPSGVADAASPEGEAEGDGLKDEVVGPAVTDGVESAQAVVGTKVATSAVAAVNRLCLSLKFPPCWAC